MLPELTTDGYHVFQPFSWVLAEGEDAHEFLQSQFSNDLSGLEIGAACYGLWLDQKGKVHGDSQIFRDGEERFYLFSYFSKADDLIEKLETFIVADDVKLEDLGSDVTGVSLLGSSIEELDALDPGSISEMDLIRLPGRRSSRPSLDIVLPMENLQKLIDLIQRGSSVSELDDSMMEGERILHRIPRVPDDIGPNELPQEGLLENEGVSFTKGCYLGQEVMSRLHSMGQVRRLIQLIESADAIPSGEFLYHEGKKVGVAKTSFEFEERFFGLALVANIVPDQSTLQLGDGNASVKVHHAVSNHG